MSVGSRLNAKRGSTGTAPLPRKTSCTAQVALQRCPILYMSKRKLMVACTTARVNAAAWRYLPRRWGYFSVMVVLKRRASGVHAA